MMGHATFNAAHVRAGKMVFYFLFIFFPTSEAECINCSTTLTPTFSVATWNLKHFTVLLKYPYFLEQKLTKERLKGRGCLVKVQKLKAVNNNFQSMFLMISSL